MKRLLVIGNKREPPEYKGNSIPLDQYIHAIDNMDYVVRINRMNNYGTTTGSRVDGLYIGGWPDFVEVFKGGEHVDVMKTVPQIFMIKLAWNLYFKDHWQPFITQKQLDDCCWCNFDYGRIRMGYKYPCSVISMIDWFLNAEPWCSEYEVWFTGIDVDNRGEILASGDPWKDTKHKMGGEHERIYLEKLMNNNKLKWLDKEIYLSLSQ